MDIKKNMYDLGNFMNKPLNNENLINATIYCTMVPISIPGALGALATSIFKTKKLGVKSTIVDKLGGFCGASTIAFLGLAYLNIPNLDPDYLINGENVKVSHIQVYDKEFNKNSPSFITTFNVVPINLVLVKNLFNKKSPVTKTKISTNLFGADLVCSYVQPEHLKLKEINIENMRSYNISINGGSLSFQENSSLKSDLESKCIQEFNNL